MMIWVWLSITCISVKIVKNFLNESSFVGKGSIASTICAVFAVFATVIEGSYLRSSTRNTCMLAARLNLVLACGGRKYMHIVKEWVLLTVSFCTSISLSLLDLFGCVTILKGGLAALEATMVGSKLVIKLWLHT